LKSDFEKDKVKAGLGIDVRVMSIFRILNVNCCIYHPFVDEAQDLEVVFQAVTDNDSIVIDEIQKFATSFLKRQLRIF
ncbi:hypothetical protein BGZ98_006632, partial [Dissophora globulifera]